MNAPIVENGILNDFFKSDIEYIDSGFSGGEYNMKFDKDRADAVSKGDAPPMLRVYGWRPWTLSLGYNQSDENVDSGECARRGYELARRPTGGRAVFHAEETTYSIVAKLPKGKTASGAYRAIHEFLLEALNKIAGGKLAFEKAQPNFGKLYKSSEFSVSCFTSAARYEIEAGGKKLVGSAQRLFGDILLQHGSILLGPAHEEIAYLTKVRSEDVRLRLLEYVKSRSISLSQVIGRDISYGECRDAIKETAGI